MKGVREGSEAERRGISKGDEVVLMNDKSVMELGWVEVERLMSGKRKQRSVKGVFNNCA